MNTLIWVILIIVILIVIVVLLKDLIGVLMIGDLGVNIHSPQDVGQFLLPVLNSG